MDLKLRNAVVVVSGGASGIGRACAELFMQEGSRVVILDFNREAAGDFCSTTDPQGVSLSWIEADLSKEEDCRNAMEQVFRKFGRLDVLVNNAGKNDAVSLDGSVSDFRRSLDQNLLHVFLLTQLALPSLKKARGSIVNIGSKVAVTGQGRTSGYAAAKGAVNALTREWALALAPDGIRVNCVLPAECETEQYQAWFQSQPDTAAARLAVEQRVPLGHRLTTPAEIASMVVFLSSPLASHVTGQLIFVDGGYTHLDRAMTSGPGSQWG